jgi:hypothetical protein
MAADKPAVPAGLLQVSGAGCVVREQALKLWERLWELKISVLMNVHEHGRTLELVAVGDNRIGMVYRSGSAERGGSENRPDDSILVNQRTDCKISVRRTEGGR